MTPREEVVRVLVVDDDSSQVGELMHVLGRDGGIAVVGQASTADGLLPLIDQTQPGAIVLDLHLRDGSSQRAIEHVMAHTPTPILVLSARIDDRHSASAVDALVAGAVDALPRPRRWTPELAAELRRTVRQISKVSVIRHPRGRGATPSRPQTRPQAERRVVVTLAASTGGPSALAVVLAGLAGLQAPVLVVQHLHPEFTSGLVEWMSRVSALPVEIAKHDELARPGRVYFAPGDLHLRLGASFRLELAAKPDAIHRPSADQLFNSAAESAGAAAVGVLLTGMGDDGARGLLAIRRRGGHTLAQDEESCAVFGMPKAAQRLGAVTDMLPLNRLADSIHRVVSEVADARA
jgi:two-component system chemotaxis response regulator CheB